MAKRVDFIVTVQQHASLRFDSIRFESFIQLSLAVCMNMYDFQVRKAFITFSLSPFRVSDLPPFCVSFTRFQANSQRYKPLYWQTLCSHVVYSFEFILVRLNIAHCARSGYRFKVLLIVYLCVHLYISLAFFLFLTHSPSFSLPLQHFEFSAIHFISPNTRPSVFFSFLCPPMVRFSLKIFFVFFISIFFFLEMFFTQNAFR